MPLNVRASTLTSSPPRYRPTSACPCPIARRRFERSSRLRAGPKITSATVIDPILASARPDHVSVGPSSRNATCSGGAPEGTATWPTWALFTTMGAMWGRRGRYRPGPAVVRSRGEADRVRRAAARYVADPARVAHRAPVSCRDLHRMAAALRGRAARRSSAGAPPCDSRSGGHPGGSPRTPASRRHTVHERGVRGRAPTSVNTSDRSRATSSASCCGVRFDSAKRPVSQRNSACNIRTTASIATKPIAMRQ